MHTQYYKFNASDFDYVQRPRWLGFLVGATITLFLAYIMTPTIYSTYHILGVLALLVLTFYMLHQFSCFLRLGILGIGSKGLYYDFIGLVPWSAITVESSTRRSRISQGPEDAYVFNFNSHFIERQQYSQTRLSALLPPSLKKKFRIRVFIPLSKSAREQFFHAYVLWMKERNAKPSAPDNPL